MFRKLKNIVKEMFFLIKKEKAYFLAPILIVIALVAILIYQVGPAVIITFVYAGL